MAAFHIHDGIFAFLNTFRNQTFFRFWERYSAGVMPYSRPERFEEAAVIREAALGAGVEDGDTIFQCFAAVLHPQMGQIAVDALPWYTL